MELRSCTQLHFIQAIRAGLVEKILNVNTCGRPALRLKKLEDIYESEDAKKRDSLSTVKPEDSFAHMVFDSNLVKTESPDPPVMERDTEKRGSNMDTSYCNSDDDEEGSDDGQTLKQLKEQCKMKKRKALHSLCSSPKEDYTDLHPEEDECDLEEPISSWKSKISKNQRGKKKSAKKSSSSSPQTEVSVKSDEISTADDSMQHSPCLPVHLSVKVEDPQTEYTECSDITSSSDDTSHLCAEQEICDVNPDLESAAKVSFTEEESDSCTVNEVCFDHLEHVEPNYLHPPIGEETMDAENLRKPCQRSLVFPTSEDKEEGHIVHPLLEESSLETNFLVNDHGSDTSNYVQSNSSVHEISRQTSHACGIQVPDMAMDSNLCCMKPESACDPCNLEDGINESLPSNLEMDSLSSSFGNHCTSWSSIHCSSPEIVLLSADDDVVATDKPPLISVSGDAARDCLSPHKSPVDFEVDSPTREEKQPLRSAPVDLESNSPEKDHQCDDAYKSLPVININYPLEQCHPPERLLSTRKAISPTSQEKLCKAMKGVELDGRIDHYKCKDKLQFTEDTQDDPTSAGPDTVVEVDAKLVGLGEVTRTFDAISTRQLTKKPRNDRKGSPPKGFCRNPHLSRSLPHASTAATSIQSCSERAIAFSQRQMHDIEGLATMLTQELKFMKAIVEEKAHSEASPTASSKYDADELLQVKTAINRATKAEETTKKWLSMMTRDCNRFCKLMKLNEKGEIASGNAIHKERKKITFADEAGGVLCHVKFIEDSIDSLDSKS
ncbi:uncharacterized protein LOC131331053 isoform X1 [Rhododendron vialii]|uniref:uncharacterized protein LOC131331053 isoform X1 n=1 Tax=Rhododendron vialii TaxID=182163 RepID=UPI00265E5D2C|nr:uncharacterized protein LOC131331053 isoform X1 [Rhododendron vialii]